MQIGKWPILACGAPYVTPEGGKGLSICGRNIEPDLTQDSRGQQEVWYSYEHSLVMCTWLADRYGSVVIYVSKYDVVSLAVSTFA